jgi:hypothetical protein
VTPPSHNNPQSQALGQFLPVYAALEAALAARGASPPLDGVAPLLLALPRRAAAMEADLEVGRPLPWRAHTRRGCAPCSVRRSCMRSSRDGAAATGGARPTLPTAFCPPPPPPRAPRAQFLLGPGWRAEVPPSAPAEAYAEHLSALAAAPDASLLLPYAWSLHVPVMLPFMGRKVGGAGSGGQGAGFWVGSARAYDCNSRSALIPSCAARPLSSPPPPPRASAPGRAGAGAEGGRPGAGVLRGAARAGGGLRWARRAGPCTQGAGAPQTCGRFLSLRNCHPRTYRGWQFAPALAPCLRAPSLQIPDKAARLAELRAAVNAAGERLSADQRVACLEEAVETFRRNNAVAAAFRLPLSRAAAAAGRLAWAARAWLLALTVALLAAAAALRARRSGAGGWV